MARSKFNLQSTALLVAILLMVVVIAVRSRGGSGLSPGAQPQWSLVTLDGERIDQDTYRGQLVVMEFWATWCSPCVSLTPHLRSIEREYSPKGVRFIGVNFDDDLDMFQQFVKQYDVTWAQANALQQTESIAEVFGINAIPWAYVISPEGAVLWSGYAGQLDDVLKQAVREYPTQVASQN